MAQTPPATTELKAAFQHALELATDLRHEYVTLEHLLLAFLRDEWAKKALRACGADLARLDKALREFLDDAMEAVPEDHPMEIQETLAVSRVLQRATIHAVSSEQKRTSTWARCSSRCFASVRATRSTSTAARGRDPRHLVNCVSHGIGEDASDAAPEGPRRRATGGENEDGETHHEPAEEVLRRPQQAAEGASTRSSVRGRASSARSACSCRRRKNSPLFVATPAWARPPSPGARQAIFERRCPRCSPTR
ncbi:MAG: Clp protease N-terminal domain-containing protein [Polyangiales bacterium]